MCRVLLIFVWFSFVQSLCAQCTSRILSLYDLIVQFWGKESSSSLFSSFFHRQSPSFWRKINILLLLNAVTPIPGRCATLRSNSVIRWKGERSLVGCDTTLPRRSLRPNQRSWKASASLLTTGLGFGTPEAEGSPCPPSNKPLSQMLQCHANDPSRDGTRRWAPAGNVIGAAA